MAQKRTFRDQRIVRLSRVSSQGQGQYLTHGKADRKPKFLKTSHTHTPHALQTVVSRFPVAETNVTTSTYTLFKFISLLSQLLFSRCIATELHGRAWHVFGRYKYIYIHILCPSYITLHFVWQIAWRLVVLLVAAKNVFSERRGFSPVSGKPQRKNNIAREAYTVVLFGGW